MLCETRNLRTHKKAILAVKKAILPAKKAILPFRSTAPAGRPAPDPRHTKVALDQPFPPKTQSAIRNRASLRRLSYPNPRKDCACTRGVFMSATQGSSRYPYISVVLGSHLQDYVMPNLR